MAFLVEDGTGLSGANAYAAIATADSYHADRGNAGWTGGSTDKQTAIVRATAYLDAAYRSRFPGYRAYGRAQGLEWPRTGAFTYTPDNGRSGAYGSGASNGYGLPTGYDYIPSNVVPREIIAATCEAALRELTTPSALAPDVSRDDRLKVFEVGPVHFEYFGGAAGSPNTAFQAIDLALASLLMPVSAFTARAVRG